MPHFYNVEVI